MTVRNSEPPTTTSCVIVPPAAAMLLGLTLLATAPPSMESFDEERAPDVCRSRDDRGPEMDGQAAIDRFAPPTRPASVTSPVSPRPAASAHDPNAADSQPTSRD